MRTQAHTKHILPKTSCSACSNEKGVNCLQVLLCWCVLAGAAFTSVAKHREICSAVLPLSTMEDSRGWLTGFGAVSGICSQDPDHSSQCVSKRERERGGFSHFTRPRWATESVITRCTVYVNVFWCMWVYLSFKSPFFMVYTTFIIVNLMAYSPCMDNADLATQNLIIL